MGLRKILKKSIFLRRILRKLGALKGLNIFKSVFINLKTQKFSDAIRFPILIYGKLHIVNLSGRVRIDPPIYFGKIRLGYNDEFFSTSKGCAVLSVLGEIVFHGRFSASVDYTISSSGLLEFGDLTRIGNGVKVRCREHISIGKATGIALESQVFDTNFHYTREVSTGIVKRNSAPITVGAFCWIGNRTTLMKGTVLPDYTIVASNSLCNKDYSNNTPDYPLLAGSPAKSVGLGGLARIFDVEEERKISSFFKQFPNAEVYKSYSGMKDESAQLEQAMRNGL